MPLPAALAARLAKRGIINESLKKAVSVDSSHEDEEVFAEDYDEQKTPQKRVGQLDNIEKNFIAPTDIQHRIKGYPGCPNKWNIYHECSLYCLKKYGEGHAGPDETYAALKVALLLKYPLPEGWQEVFDPGTGRCYYWNMDTDTVSWFPPLHPKHVFSEPACVLREELNLAESEEETSSDNDSDVEDDKKPTAIKRYDHEKFHSKGRNKKKENDLDPMDPAAYSEAPRGNWASGLMSEAVTGVDTTASGSLYQQRPLPSPGAILRKKKKRN